MFVPQEFRRDNSGHFSSKILMGFSLHQTRVAWVNTVIGDAWLNG
jgi:hypothetical protein